jgi:hypothetical protein
MSLKATTPYCDEAYITLPIPDPNVTRRSTSSPKKSIKVFHLRFHAESILYMIPSSSDKNKALSPLLAILTGLPAPNVVE